MLLNNSVYVPLFYLCFNCSYSTSKFVFVNKYRWNTLTLNKNQSINVIIITNVNTYIFLFLISIWFEPWSGLTKDYKIGICCFYANHAASRRKSKNWNQDNVSECGDMSIRRLLFQWASTVKIQLSCWSSTKWTSWSFHWKLTCSRQNIQKRSWKIAELTLNNNHSLTISIYCLINI